MSFIKDDTYSFMWKHTVDRTIRSVSRDEETEDKTQSKETVRTSTPGIKYFSVSLFLICWLWRDLITNLTSFRYLTFNTWFIAFYSFSSSSSQFTSGSGICFGFPAHTANQSSQSKACVCMQCGYSTGGYWRPREASTFHITLSRLASRPVVLSPPWITFFPQLSAHCSASALNPAWKRSADFYRDVLTRHTVRWVHSEMVQPIMLGWTFPNLDKYLCTGDQWCCVCKTKSTKIRSDFVAARRDKLDKKQNKIREKTVNICCVLK